MLYNLTTKYIQSVKQMYCMTDDAYEYDNNLLFLHNLQR